MNEYGLMYKEVDNYKRFCDKHKACNPGAREKMMEEDVAPTYTLIILSMSTIGMFPSAKCKVCGVKESIACGKRIERM